MCFCTCDEVIGYMCDRFYIRLIEMLFLIEAPEWLLFIAKIYNLEKRAEDFSFLFELS